MLCRHCEFDAHLPLIDLGHQPASNAYLHSADKISPEQVLPLRVFVCEHCWLVQTEDHVARELLFAADYAYFSSTSSSWCEHAAQYAKMIVGRLQLSPRSFVIEIASNDGYLLRHFAARDIPCLGIEPTASTAAAAIGMGLPTRQAFFGEDEARKVAAEYSQANLVIGNNVFAHVPDINDFSRGLAAVLAPGGTITLEFPSLQALVEQTLFDTIYHEHFYYLSMNTTERIFRSVGLRVYDVDILPTHGGSFRVYGCHADDPRPASGRLMAILATEDAAGLAAPTIYRGFQRRAERIRDELSLFLQRERAAGRRVAAYGAAAKGNTLLNFAGVTAALLPYVCDAAPSKQGRLMPGSRIPILSPDHMVADNPDTVLILPWNIATEIKNQMAPRLPPTTRFYVAIPSLSAV